MHSASGEGFVGSTALFILSGCPPVSLDLCAKAPLPRAARHAVRIALPCASLCFT